MILFKDESYRIIGSCMKVHSVLGTGFLEAVYQEALEKEFTIQNIPFKRQLKLNIFYRDQKLEKYYIADFLCYDEIILELKVMQYISNNEYLQINNYLKATNKTLGMLLNFGSPSFTYHRVINNKKI